jgi:phenylacetate-coenzyme A ligase PaaK-like adenylate-forming protein
MNELCPLITPEGERMLKFLREHPAAPIFRNESGNKLSGEDLSRLREIEREVLAAKPGWAPGETPAWLGDFLRHALGEVPHYRRYGRSDAPLEELPTFSRAELGRDVAAFVPDDVPIDRLVNFRTSGTTGHPILVASHPVVAASYLAFHKKALAYFGVELRAGAGQVGVVLVGYQKKCFSYVSVTPQMGESGLVKLNLHPADWRDPEDRARYIDALDAEMYTGDPLSFLELAKLDFRSKPRALLSTSMTLLPETRRLLEQRFGCPVLDVYSLNEAGPVAFSDGDHWALLQPRMFVEILDDEGRRVSPGERGEITLTGGMNPWLPLVRYRTGDFAALVFHGGQPRLEHLSGRAPVRFRATNGEWLNNIDVTHALGRFALSQWTLAQKKDGSFELRSSGGNATELERALRELFGADAAIDVANGVPFDGKVRQYVSELD